MARRTNCRGKLLVDLSIGNVSIENNTDVFVSNAYDPTVDHRNTQQALITDYNLTSGQHEYNEPFSSSLIQHESMRLNNNIYKPLEPMFFDNDRGATNSSEAFGHVDFLIEQNYADTMGLSIPSVSTSNNFETAQTTIIQPLNCLPDESGQNNPNILKQSNETDFILNYITGVLEPKKLSDRQTLILNDQTGEFDEYDQEAMETESEDITEIYDKRRDRKYNMSKRLKGEKYVGRKKIQEEVKKGEENKKREDNNKGKENFVVKNKRCMKRKPCKHDLHTIKTERSFQCGIISEEQRESVFAYFWSLQSWEAKKAYIKNLVRLRPIIRRRKESRADSSKKQKGCDWYLPNENNVMVKVCKNFMLCTIDMNNETLTEWTNTLYQNDYPDEAGPSASQNKRDSKKKNDTTSNIRIEHRKASAIKEWLNLLPKVPSHYCRSSSKRTYVEDAFRNKSHMFKVYKKWCITKNIPFAQRKLFCKILKEEKISIFKPRKDQCDTCTAFKEGNLAQDEYDKHINMKQEAYIAKERATALCSLEVLVITVDVQSVLLCPKLQVSVQYYKQKLQMHNYTIYCNNDGEVHLYVWHEGDGGVTANEFTTCLIDFLGQKATEGYKKVIVISDGCCYQNRNKTLSSALLNFSREKYIEIEQLILEKGHTMMQVDSVHSTLEGMFKPPIYSPSHYVSLMAQARPSKPYIIHNVDYTFFKNYEVVCQFDSIRPGKKSGDPVVTDIRGTLYKGGEFFYKLRHPDGWQLLPQRLQNNDKGLLDLYGEPRTIEKSKYDSLQSLKKYMHRDNHFFYDNLKSK